MNETFEQYMTALKKLSQSCAFDKMKDEVIRDLFICGINKPQLQRQLLGMSDLTLDKALAVRTNFAIVEEQVTQLEKVTECQVKKEFEIDMLRTKKKISDKTKIVECEYCGYQHDYGRCPAFGKTCMICRRRNHFAKKCRNKKVNLVMEQ